MTTSIEERSALTDAVRRCVERSAGPRAFLADGERLAGTDEALWSTLAQQVGVVSLLVPEAWGGAGGAYADLAAVVELLGAALAPVPVLPTAGMASGVLLADGGPAAQELLARIAKGATLATVAWADVSGPVSGSFLPEVTADLAAGTLTGTAGFVVSGAEADLVLVPASTDKGVVVVAVEGDAPCMVRRGLTTLDLTRGMAEVAFAGAPFRLVSDVDVAADALAVGSDLTLVVLAAEQVGLAQRCLDVAVAWCAQRVQFDRPIGSFQAIKHRLVDLLLQVELSRSAKEEAVAAADRHLEDPNPHSARALRIAASMAKAVCGEAAVEVAREALHLFGGIGFTWEHDAHLYYRRALSDALLLGDASRHRVRLAAALGV
ncbi:MAG: acyl-CoA dehydrogenase [Actinomycetota bacterium]|nr:acyl-CoA dehydrogenase [Actinomycetota bacterium]